MYTGQCLSQILESNGVVARVRRQLLPGQAGSAGQ